MTISCSVDQSDNDRSADQPTVEPAIESTAQDRHVDLVTREPIVDHSTHDAAILAEVLRFPDATGRFTVVEPMTTLRGIGAGGPEALARTQSYVRHSIRGYDEHIDRLFVLLVERNRQPVRLELASDPAQGYLIDDDGKFDAYFSEGGGGWERWREENPKARSFTSVSLPAYDPETGLVLVYRGGQSDWLSGAGHLILYRYTDGTLEELGAVMMWIS